MTCEERASRAGRSASFDDQERWRNDLEEFTTVLHYYELQKSLKAVTDAEYRVRDLYSDTVSS